MNQNEKSERLNFKDSLIDCSDCRNYWLIKNSSTIFQINGGYCRDDHGKILFSEDVKTRFNQKCKWFQYKLQLINKILVINYNNNKFKKHFEAT